MIYRVPVFNPETDSLPPAFQGVAVGLIRFPEALQKILESQEDYTFFVWMQNGDQPAVLVWESEFSRKENAALEGRARLQFDYNTLRHNLNRSGHHAHQLKIEVCAMPRSAVIVAHLPAQIQGVISLSWLLAWGGAPVGSLSKIAESHHSTSG